MPHLLHIIKPASALQPNFIATYSTQMASMYLANTCYNQDKHIPNYAHKYKFACMREAHSLTSGNQLLLG